MSIEPTTLVFIQDVWYFHNKWWHTQIKTHFLMLKESPRPENCHYYSKLSEDESGWQSGKELSQQPGFDSRLGIYQKPHHLVCPNNDGSVARLT